jgi:hypothetical protein
LWREAAFGRRVDDQHDFVGQVAEGVGLAALWMWWLAVCMGRCAGDEREGEREERWWRWWCDG